MFTHHLFAISGLTVLIIVIAAWSLVWKGIALWVSARNHQRAWFIVMLIVNTAGILEIIYLLAFRSDKKEGSTKSLFNNPAPKADDEPVAETPSA
jgi:hypothetical protein